MIHVCFGLYDKTGSYSKFTGTAMLSLFDNTTSNVTVHILHDNTLTNDNREKFSYVAGRYGQRVKFYNVEKLCAPTKSRRLSNSSQTSADLDSLSPCSTNFLSAIWFRPTLKK